MIKCTWEEEPEKRPSFADIVQFFQEQNFSTEDNFIDEIDDSAITSDNDSGYLDIFQA